jgi:hypothetical protein
MIECIGVTQDMRYVELSLLQYHKDVSEVLDRRIYRLYILF